MESKQYDLQHYLNSLISTVSNENPLDYFNSMYKSVNPMAIEMAVSAGEKIIQQQNKKNGSKVANVFMNIGSDSINNSFLQGIIAALLWMPSYIRDLAEPLKLSRDEVNTCLKVLKQANLPTVFDAYDIEINGKTTKVESSSCRHFALFLTSITQWCYGGVSQFKNSGEPRSNIDLVRFLTATALNSFPSIPFTTYFLGQCKTNDYAKLAEQLTKEFNWTDYMSKEAYSINQPRFQVCSEHSPLVGCCSNPLAMLLVGETTNNKTTWLSVFCEGEEFSRLCLENSLTMNEVKDYVLKTSKQQHQKNINENNKIALFVDKNKIVAQGFQLLHRFENDEDTSGNI